MGQLICQEFVKTPPLGICKPQVRVQQHARSADTCFPHEEGVGDLCVMSGYARERLICGSASRTGQALQDHKNGARTIEIHSGVEVTSFQLGRVFSLYGITTLILGLLKGKYVLLFSKQREWTSSCFHFRVMYQSSFLSSPLS